MMNGSIGLLHGTSVYMPAIPKAEFDLALEQIAGRNLTAEEWSQVERMAKKGWALRVVASELFGDELTDAFFAPKT